MTARPIARAIAQPIARAISHVLAVAVAAEMQAGIGSTTESGGQLWTSTLPNNTFQPQAFGWESYGEEP